MPIFTAELMLQNLEALISCLNPEFVISVSNRIMHEGSASA